ncbi:MAG: hypothetical protein ACREV9_00935 [Burkholderiales bacterium]
MRFRLGKILVDGGFVSADALDQALKSQTKRPLGQVLISMGALRSVELKTALALQSQLALARDPAKVATGPRQNLGELLIQAKCITREQLDLALLKQTMTKGKLGSILIDWNLLTEKRLDAALAFQERQESPKHGFLLLKLGNLLVAQGSITETQLHDAISESGREKIGETLIRKGLVTQEDVDAALALQRKLLNAALLASMSLADPQPEQPGKS